MTTPPNATQTTYASQCGQSVWVTIVGDQCTRRADGAEREVQDTGCLVQHDMPTPESAYTPLEREAQHDVRLDELRVDANTAKPSLCTTAPGHPDHTFLVVYFAVFSFNFFSQARVGIISAWTAGIAKHFSFRTTLPPL